MRDWSDSGDQGAWTLVGGNVTEREQKAGVSIIHMTQYNVRYNVHKCLIGDDID